MAVDAQFEALSRQYLSMLTERQQQIVLMVTDGGSNASIGTELGISSQTVERHLSDIYDRTGMGSRLELASWCWHRERQALKARIAELESSVPAYMETGIPVGQPAVA